MARATWCPSPEGSPRDSEHALSNASTRQNSFLDEVGSLGDSRSKLTCAPAVGTDPCNDLGFDDMKYRPRHSSGLLIPSKRRLEVRKSVGVGARASGHGTNRNVCRLLMPPSPEMTLDGPSLDFFRSCLDPNSAQAVVEGVEPFRILHANSTCEQTCRIPNEFACGKTLRIIQGPKTELSIARKLTDATRCRRGTPGHACTPGHAGMLEHWDAWGHTARRRAGTLVVMRPAR